MGRSSFYRCASLASASSFPQPTPTAADLSTLSYFMSVYDNVHESTTLTVENLINVVPCYLAWLIAKSSSCGVSTKGEEVAEKFCFTRKPVFLVE